MNRSTLHILAAIAAVTSILLFAAALAVAPGGGPVRALHIDYSPVPDVGWDDPRIGTSGAQVWDYGTVLYVWDANNQWNAWTETSKLTYKGEPGGGGITGCGDSADCVIYRNDQGWMTVNGESCQLPALPYSTWGITYSSVPSLNHLYPDCPAFGTDSVPVFVIGYNNDGPSGAQTYDGKVHIGRHEMAHALGVGHHTGSCWTMHGYWYPLMHNSSSGCSSYPANKYATANERAKAKSENGW